MAIKATLYIPPNGKRQVIDIVDIDKLDEDWFNSVKAELSVEEVNGQIVTYADVGIVEGGTTVEAIELDRGRTCRETMHALRLQAEDMLKRKEAV